MSRPSRQGFNRKTFRGLAFLLLFATAAVLLVLQVRGILIVITLGAEIVVSIILYVVIARNSLEEKGMPREGDEPTAPT